MMLKLLRSFYIPAAAVCCFFPAKPTYAQSDAQYIIDSVVRRPANPDIQWLNLHFQTTYIYQYKPPFQSPYAGKNSLTGGEEKQNSLTATLYAGVRLWKGAALFVNPELAGGSGLSGALGMGGSSNGETFRVGDPAPTLYMARTYLEQTFKLKAAPGDTSGGYEKQEDDANQLAGYVPTSYIRITAGKYSLGDLFDNNEYSNSPRTQFMNWALMNNGAWDYAANVRGYTYAVTIALQKTTMLCRQHRPSCEARTVNYKLGIAALPKEANGAKLNTDISKGFALNAEVSRNHFIHGQPGNLRLLAYYNTAETGNYEQAIQYPGTDGPDVTLSRGEGLRHKLGFGLNADQQLDETFGLFGRIGWNDGKNETWAFTEIDRTLSLGLSVKGKKWKRPGDSGGIALLANGLSQQHRNYLAAGGNGFILGDGKLNYAPEAVAEVYYTFLPTSLPVSFSGDYQLCFNPGYNADRGPVHIFSVRLHVEL
jgi:high affinity Mn2+ porin